MRQTALIPPVIGDFIYLAVSGIADVQFTDASVCPVCFGLLVAHDQKKRKFSTIRTENGEEHVYVYVKRFHCRTCGKLCYAYAPFYAMSRFGSPVVDLCVTLSKKYSYSYTASLLSEIGIIIDRGTVRKMAQIQVPDIPVADLDGIVIPQSILALSTLIMQSQLTGPLTGLDILKAVGYPFQDPLSSDNSLNSIRNHYWDTG